MLVKDVAKILLTIQGGILDSDFGRSGCTRCRWLATVCVDAVDSLGESPIDISEHQPVNVTRAIRGASRILRQGNEGLVGDGNEEKSSLGPSSMCCKPIVCQSDRD